MTILLIVFLVFIAFFTLVIVAACIVSSQANEHLPADAFERSLENQTQSDQDDEALARLKQVDRTSLLAGHRYMPAAVDDDAVQTEQIPAESNQ